MSASASKKRRKEELLAQQAAPAKKEKKGSTAKKIILGLVAALLAVALIITIGLLIKGQRYKADYDVNEPVMKVGDYEITAPMFNHFYTSQLNNDYSYALMSQYGMLTSGAPLSQQQMMGSEYVEDLINQTKTTISNTVNIYLEAKNAGYTLTEDDQKMIDDSVNSLKQAARNSGFNFFGLTYDWFCSQYFGAGCTVQTYRNYLELVQYCIGYQESIDEDFDPSADEIADEYAANPDDYHVVSFSVYTVNAESDGTDENGTATYSDAAKAAAEEKANEAAANFPEDATSATDDYECISSDYSEDAAKWLFAADRKAGDISVFPNTAKTAYRVIRYEALDVNDYNLMNAYLLKIPMDTEEGDHTYADAFKKLCDGAKDGISEDDFTKLAEEAGLSASAGMIDRYSQIDEVTSFLYDSARKDGDIFTYTDEEAGYYYVVRFNHAEEDTYQTYLVKTKLHNDAKNEWLEGIYDNNTAEVFDEAMVNTYTDHMVY